MRLGQLFLILFLSLGILSCVDQHREEEAETKVWIDLYGRYLQLDQQYKIEASFLRGDTLPAAIPFKPEGAVQFEARTMTPRQLTTDLIRYQVDFAGPHQDEGTFTVEDEALALPDFVMPFHDIDSFRIKDEILSKETGGEILLSSTVELGKLEELVILISDQEKNSESYYLEGPFRTDRIAIAPATIASLSSGPAQLYMVRKTKGVQQDKNKTLNYLIEYYTDTQPFTIEN